MKQSTVIFGSMLFAFVVYITMRGQLPAYLDLFKSGASRPAGSSGGSSSSTSEPSDNSSGGVGNIIDRARGMMDQFGINF